MSAANFPASDSYQPAGDPDSTSAGMGRSRSERLSSCPGPASDAPLRAIELTGAFNVRDLGGLVTDDGLEVKPGLVYRSDGLAQLTAADKTILFTQLGIAEIVDLRTAEEAGGDGLQDARLFPDMSVHHLSVMPEGRIGREPFPSGDPEKLAHRYLVNLEEGAPAVDGTLSLIRRAAAAGTPLLFHCAAGRDRTGLVAAVLLDILGVRRSQIIADYVASNAHAHHVTARLRQNPLYDNNGSSHAHPGDVDLLNPCTMDRFLTLLDAEYGGGPGWARTQGLDVELLRDLLLEPAGPVGARKTGGQRAVEQLRATD